MMRIRHSGELVSCKTFGSVSNDSCKTVWLVATVWYRVIFYLKFVVDYIPNRTVHVQVPNITGLGTSCCNPVLAYFKLVNTAFQLGFISNPVRLAGPYKKKIFVLRYRTVLPHSVQDEN
jgi:hypothetical protein